MLNDDIERLYYISCRYLGSFNGQHLFRNSHYLMLLIPLKDFRHTNMDEVISAAEYLEQSGIRRIGKVISNKDGQLVSKLNDTEEFVLLSVSSIPVEETEPLAEQLAQFHQAGKSISFQSLVETPYDKWPEYWSFRIDQLEKWRDACIEDNDYSEFNHWFLTTYPYYMALAENAIQYAVDLRIDEGYQESPTICHYRFNEKQWTEPLKMKKSSDWVIDHPSRDIAEWVRRIVQTEDTSNRAIRKLLQQYAKKQAITPYTIKLIYSRLLFPIHYIETIEDYYSNHDKREKHQTYQRLVKVLNQSKTYEEFLISYPSLFNERIKTIDWLSNTSQGI